MRLKTIAIASCLTIIISACSDNTPTATSTTTTTTASPTTTARPIGTPPQLKVTEIATFSQPTAMAQMDGDDALYIAERGGLIKVFRNGITDPTPILDLTKEVKTDGSEQGLLGITFAPASKVFYVNYIDTNGDTQIVEFTLGADGTADLHTRREILVIDQPYPNHNGGQLAFGPDKMLYIATGDGGSQGDPKKNGQNLSSLLGKILRIDPKPTDSANYTIPFDNPFKAQAGARGEIWAYGLRNPWRFSFDVANESMWIADVGQGKWEEINKLDELRRGGANFGWSLREGTHEFSGGKPTGSIDPVYEYDHSNGACSVTGGYVYHGHGVADLKERYIYGDYCNGQISTLTLRGDKWQADATNLKVEKIGSFGVDHNGEVYVLSQTGLVGRIDPA